MFNERIIEQNRPLDEAHFFSRYSADRYGNEVGGYYSDRYYSTKNCTLEMRKAWAEIVNEKFKEKGMNSRISEKSLDAQYWELKSQGRDEEAEEFNRVPAPHLGDMYKNPRNFERIQSLEKEIDKTVDISVSSDTKDAEQESDRQNEIRIKNAKAMEEKMIIFAADALLRRVAKELQQEQIKYKAIKEKEEQEKNDEMAYEPAPSVITVADLVDEMKKRSVNARKAYESVRIEGELLRKNVLKDAALWGIAKEKILPGFRNIQKREQETRLALQILEKKKLALQSDDPKHSQLLADIQAAKKTWTEAKKKYDDANQILQEKSPELQILYNAMKSAQDEKQISAKKKYIAEIRAKREADMYYAKALALEETFPLDKIIYSEPLPQMVDFKSKLDGRISLSRVPHVFYKGSTWFITTPKSGLPKEGRSATVQAVRFGDNILQGKSKSYTVLLTYKDAVSAYGKPVKELCAEKITPSDHEVRYYQIRNFADTPESKKQRTGASKISDGLSANKTRLANLTDANRDAPSGHLIHWNSKEERAEDIYENTEEALKTWSDRMKLGNGKGVIR